MLDEKDEQVYEHLRAAVLRVGAELIPLLEDALIDAKDVGMQERYQDLMKNIRFLSIYDGLKAWKESEKQDLLEAFFLISRYEYPSLEMMSLNMRLSALSVDLWVELNPDMTALEQANVLNRIFFDHANYSSDKKTPFALPNMFLNTVLQNKKGNDITLGILFQHIAHTQKLPLYGVNLSMNYVLAYTKKMGATALSDILFYINPYNEGIVFDYLELEQHLKSLDIPFTNIEKQAEICTNEDTIVRLLKGLVHSYGMESLHQKAADMRKLLAIFRDEGW